LSLSDLSIRRPVLTWMMTLALATFGVLGFLRLGIDRYPDMEFPYVGVKVTMQGASPTTMEDEVVEVLEEAFATIEGVRHIHSEATQDAAQVLLEFELGHDIDVAAQDVRDKLNRSMNDLPREIEPPALGKADYSQFPIIYAPISSDLSVTATTEYVDRSSRWWRRFQVLRGCPSSADASATSGSGSIRRRCAPAGSRSPTCSRRCAGSTWIARVDSSRGPRSSGLSRPMRSSARLASWGT